jgi:hypothetical protein
MKKLLCIIFFGMSILADCFAQNNLPPIYYLTLESDYYRLDTAHYQVLEDWNNNLTFEQVIQSPLNEQFHQNSDAEILTFIEEIRQENGRTKNQVTWSVCRKPIIQVV